MDQSVQNFSLFTLHSCCLLTDQVYLIKSITVGKWNTPGVTGVSETATYVTTCLRTNWTCSIRKCHTGTQNVDNQGVILCFQMPL